MSSSRFARPSLNPPGQSRDARPGRGSTDLPDLLPVAALAPASAQPSPSCDGVGRVHGPLILLKPASQVLNSLHSFCRDLRWFVSSQATLAQKCVRGVTLLHHGNLWTLHNLVFSRRRLGDPRPAHFSQHVPRRGDPSREGQTHREVGTQSQGSGNGLTARLPKEGRLIGKQWSSARLEEDLASNEVCSPRPGADP